jgi:hypothetical protein
MPDGTRCVVTLRGTTMGGVRGPSLWDSIKREMKTRLLHYHVLVTAAKDAVYEFYYDDTGDWVDKTNHAAEALTGLVWFGPCIIMKVDVPPDDIKTGKFYFTEYKTFVDAIGEGDDLDSVLNALTF